VWATCCCCQPGSAGCVTEIDEVRGRPRIDEDGAGIRINPIFLQDAEAGVGR
jgi:hypothetical protein